MINSAVLLSLSSHTTRDLDLLWQVLLVTGAATLIGSRIVRRLKGRLPNVHLGQFTPAFVHRDRKLPNVETLLKRQLPIPPEKVPHVPAVCRSCETLDVLPEDGVRPTTMHWSGLCMDCYKLTPEGQAALAAGVIE